jgi:hypothetical protein
MRLTRSFIPVSIEPFFDLSDFERNLSFSCRNLLPAMGHGRSYPDLNVSMIMLMI